MSELLPSDRKAVESPYIHELGVIKYVGVDNEYMQLAVAYAKEFSLDKVMPNTSVVVRDGEVIGIAANGSDFHETNGCERVRLNMPSGQGYELCEGCSPKNHGEPKAVANAQERTGEERLDGAEIYLWGHYWCCEPCWDSMVDAGITTVYLVDGSEVLFNKTHPDNIIGRQFDHLLPGLDLQ